jgi:hypothetical protein
MFRRVFVASLPLVVASSCGSFDEGSNEIPDAGSDASADGGNGGGVDAATADASPEAGDAKVAPADAGDDARVLRVFVTGTGYTDVTTAGIADTKCAAEANGRLTGKFVAWYPDAIGGKSAPARLVQSDGGAVDGPWYRVDGKQVAATRAALSNTSSVPLTAAIELGPAGTVVPGSVWTGTLADGGIGTVCPSGVNPTSGHVNQTGPAWTQQTNFTATCNSSLGLYCFQVE